MTIGSTIYFYKKYILIHRERPDQPKQIIDADIVPGMGQIKLSEITTLEISQFLQSIVERGSPVHANKTLTLLKQMFNYAVSSGVMFVNPTLAIKHKIIGGDEHSIYERYCIAFKVLILTGVRSGELLQAKWCEIESDYWIIPAEHIKTRKKNPKPHKVYLSRQTKALIELIRNDSEFIFPHRTENRPVYEKTLSAIVRDSLRDRVLDMHWTPHDLRRSFATAQSEIIKTEPMVIEKMLNHSLGGMMAVYNKAEMLDERKQALQSWADHLLAYIHSDNILEFKRRG